MRIYGNTRADSSVCSCGFSRKSGIAFKIAYRHLHGWMSCRANAWICTGGIAQTYESAHEHTKSARVVACKMHNLTHTIRGSVSY